MSKNKVAAYLCLSKEEFNDEKESNFNRSKLKKLLVDIKRA